MKICIAQTKSLKGKVQESIQNHLRLIEHTIELKANLMVFPELSITGYEPGLAKELVFMIDDSVFNPFQTMSDNNEITIGVGMPTLSIDGVNISMLIFQPNEKRIVYSKQMLHSDELPYFVCGNHQTILDIKEKKIAIGICYETLQRKHFLNARGNDADIYIASVAKTEEGIEKSYRYFSKIAKEFKTPILMSNCVGHCDGFLSVGQSAVWNKEGELIKKLDDESLGVLVFDTKSEKVELHQIPPKERKSSD